MLAGADAIVVLRAGGFIAAIEPVASELSEGTVIEQDPPAGVWLSREAVVALRLAVSPIPAPEVVSADLEPPVEHIEPGTEDDDTERWFAALALRDGGKPSEPAPRRRRKHRVARRCANELVFDPSPTPVLWVQEPPAAFTPSDRGGRFLGVRSLLTSALCVLPASLAGAPWRRGSALLAILLLSALLGTRFLSGRRQGTTSERVPAATAHAQLAPRAIVHRATPPARRPTRAKQAPRVLHPRARAARIALRISSSESRPAKASSPPSPDRRAVVAAAAATHATASAHGQFAYLGQ